MTLSGPGSPIRKSADQRVLAPPRSFSQRATSFIASRCQGIHQMPFSRLIASTRHAQTQKPALLPDPRQRDGIPDPHPRATISFSRIQRRCSHDSYPSAYPHPRNHSRPHRSTHTEIMRDSKTRNLFTLSKNKHQQLNAASHQTPKSASSMTAVQAIIIPPSHQTRTGWWSRPGSNR